MKLLINCLAVFFMTIFCTNNAVAFDLFSSDAEKIDREISQALQAYENGLVDESIVNLNKIYSELKEKVYKNPNDHELYFVLAKAEFITSCLQNKNNCQEQAHKKFLILVGKDKGYTSKIFEFYRGQSDRYVVAKDMKRAMELFVTAYRDFQTDQEKVKTAANEVYNNGLVNLKQGNRADASIRFWAVMEVSPTMRPTIRDDIIKLSGQASDPNRGLEILSLIYQMFSANDWPEANKTAAALIGKNKPENAELLTVSFPVFKKLPSNAQAIIIAIIFPPDFITYYSGQKKVFVLKADGWSDHYIRPALGTHVDLGSKYGEYEMVTRSGKRYPKGKSPEYNTEDFRIHAITDTDMQVAFK